MAPDANNPGAGKQSYTRHAPWLTALFFFLLYTFSRSPNLGAAHDSIYYLRSIETGVALLHPHHLIYNAVGRGWMLLTGLDAAFAVPLLNALLGALTILFLQRFLVELVGPRAALFWTLLYGASFGPWFYAATIEVYLLPLPFLLLAFRLAHRPAPTIAGATAIGALLGIAILGHQTNVLILPALLLNGRWKMEHGKWKISLILTLLATAAVTAGLPYILAARHAGESLAVWSTFYLRELDLGAISVMTLPKALIGIGRFFIGGHFFFAFGRLPGLESILAGHTLADERFLVRNMPLALASVLAILSAVWFSALGLFLLSSRRSSTKLFVNRDLGISLILWFLAYALFFTWWEPANVEFWIATMIPAVLIAARRTAPRLEGVNGRAWFLLPISLLIINLAGSIGPLSRVENDYYRQKALEVIATNDETVSKDEWIIGPYVERLRRNAKNR